MSPFQPPPPPPPPPKVEPLPEQEWVKQLDPATVCKDGRTVADRVDLLKEAAGEQFRDGNHRMAIQMYSEALKLAPSHTLFSNRSACYCASRKYKEAFEDACKCIDMMPTFGKVGTNSCAPHCAPHWIRAMVSPPSSRTSQGYARKGAALHGMDRWTEAISAYEAGLKMEPGMRALEQGITDARKRLALAGGEWKWIGHRQIVDDDGYNAPFLKHPTRLCSGPGGGICVIDQGRNRIVVMNKEGTYVRCSLNADQQINRAGLFTEPHGVAFDGTHVYTTDSMRCRVIKCDATSGKLVASWGRSGQGDQGFEDPWGVAVADTSALHGGQADTTLFVCDSKNHRVVAIDAVTMTYRYAFGQWGFDDGDLNKPHGISVCGNMVAVADNGNCRVCLYTLDGKFLRALGKDGLNSTFVAGPEDVALTAEHLFVLEEGSGVESKDKPLPITYQGANIHALNPHTGALLRPPLLPPFSLNDKKRGVLLGLGVFNGSLYTSSGYGAILCLPRDQQEEGKPTAVDGA